MQIDINQDPILLWILAKNYDGTFKSDILSGTVRVFFIDSGTENNVLAITSLSELSTGKWIYEWSPVSLTIGQYLIEFSLIDNSGFGITILEDLIITDSNDKGKIDFQYVASDKGTDIELGLWVEDNGEVLKDIDSIALVIYDIDGALISDLGIVSLDTFEGVFKFTVSSSALSEASPYYLNIIVTRGSVSYEANMGLSVA
jgi:hypothetical protein